MAGGGLSIIGHEPSILGGHPRVKALYKVAGYLLGVSRAVELSQLLNGLSVGYELGKDLKRLSRISGDSESIFAEIF